MRLIRGVCLGACRGACLARASRVPRAGGSVVSVVSVGRRCRVRDSKLPKCGCVWLSVAEV
jgi:hypothetical protein